MVDVPAKLKACFQDYRMHLVCVSDNDWEAFPAGEARNLFQVLYALRRGQIDQILDVRVAQETYRAIVSLEGDKSLLNYGTETEGGDVEMSTALKEFRANAKAEGKAEAILDLLNDFGIVSEELAGSIMMIRDLNLLKELLKLASKIDSVEHFAEAMQRMCLGDGVKATV